MRRRGLLVGGAGVAGTLLVGWAVLPPRSRVGRPDTLPGADGRIALNGWIRIAPDGAVALAMPRSEMGQGVHTALALLVAEELDVAPARIELAEPGADTLYGNVAVAVDGLPFTPAETEPGRQGATVLAARWIVAKLAREAGLSLTGGSSSVADAWEPLRWAAATARARLLGAASLQWRLPAEELAVADGVVSHAAGGQRAHYGELAKLAAATPPGDVALKPREAWRLIGRPQPRLDLPAKVSGAAVFGLDVRLPGLRYAVVRHAPQLGGAPGAFDPDPVLRLPGVERVVRLPSLAGSTPALAVVGRSTWHARRGADALVVDWRAPPAVVLDSAAIAHELERTVRRAAQDGSGHVFHAQGEADTALAAAARRIERLYRAPYLAHAALEPLNCTARVAGGRVELWVPTQVPSFARATAARIAEVPQDRVVVHVTALGGGFGRRLETDVVAQAVRVALECGGAPVQLSWPREEDFTHDFYRPAAAALLQAGLDGEGRLQVLRLTSAGDALVPRYLERNAPGLALPVDLPDRTASEGLFDLPYGVPHLRIAHRATGSGVPIGFWRSVGHSHNAFFAECFVDELAAAAGRDPLAFRLELLQERPRHAAVLRLAADKAGWGSALPPGTARGLALHESFGSIVAQVVEARLAHGRPSVRRVVVAADVGTVVNPDTVAQQMEGSVLFALSAALYGRIDIVDSRVQQTNFPTHPIATLAETPRIEVHLVPSTRAPAGVGEPGVPPFAPALANALFALTGRRLRELPLVP
ncbi:MAG: xanthine dehydrogenase family protein molybdopterin-binding subunit [Piscinibacter sp.]|uniref:xanthine dehydrogenase family protein molybdopterin-binding subunit n=1 Tax=Piscinibacter sp. TaxID=1903157 RepID=UPI00258C9330|nr:molybdopterin cofactor-binding domain-containing protein [Piscinibacter sp.]MCW5665214.1 xanthine dehydrogenase family protein molybdopterin-binding subunit [Piscinibacter sp.]